MSAIRREQTNDVRRMVGDGFCVRLDDRKTALAVDPFIACIGLAIAAIISVRTLPMPVA